MSHALLPRLPLLATLALLSAGTIATPAAAQLGGLSDENGLSGNPLNNERPLVEAPDNGPQIEERRRTPQLSRAQAAARARGQHGGRVLSVHWTGDSYQVKLLRHGEVRIVRIVDAPPEQKEDR